MSPYGTGFAAAGRSTLPWTSVPDLPDVTEHSEVPLTSPQYLINATEPSRAPTTSAQDNGGRDRYHRVAMNLKNLAERDFFQDSQGRHLRDIIK